MKDLRGRTISIAIDNTLLEKISDKNNKVLHSDFRNLINFLICSDEINNQLETTNVPSSFCWEIYVNVTDKEALRTAIKASLPSPVKNADKEAVEEEILLFILDLIQFTKNIEAENPDIILVYETFGMKSKSAKIMSLSEFLKTYETPIKVCESSVELFLDSTQLKSKQKILADSLNIIFFVLAVMVNDKFQNQVALVIESTVDETKNSLAQAVAALIETSTLVAIALVDSTGEFSTSVASNLSGFLNNSYSSIQVALQNLVYSKNSLVASGLLELSNYSLGVPSKLSDIIIPAAEAAEIPPLNTDEISDNTSDATTELKVAITAKFKVNENKKTQISEEQLKLLEPFPQPTGSSDEKSPEGSKVSKIPTISGPQNSEDIVWGKDFKPGDGDIKIQIDTNKPTITVGDSPLVNEPTITVGDSPLVNAPPVVVTGSDLSIPVPPTPVPPTPVLPIPVLPPVPSFLRTSPTSVNSSNSSDPLTGMSVNISTSNDNQAVQEQSTFGANDIVGGTSQDFGNIAITSNIPILDSSNALDISGKTIGDNVFNTAINFLELGTVFN